MLQEKRAKDRRIQKTKNLLHEALSSLIREKPYEAIVVQEILDRANVGRSTFYTHFRDKDELLISGIRDILSVLPRELPYTGKRYERIISFSLPIFEHIHRHRRTSRARMGVRGRAIIHEQLQKVLAGRIASDLRKDCQSRKLSGQIPADDLLVQYVASTFVLVLNWWVDSRDPLPPDEIDRLFRTLVLPALAANCE